MRSSSHCSTASSARSACSTRRRSNSLPTTSLRCRRTSSDRRRVRRMRGTVTETRNETRMMMKVTIFQLQSPTSTLSRDFTRSLPRRRKSSRLMSGADTKGVYFAS
ncbi:hypothetical protein GSI_09745 [Ganoderma sinense ZZ0214-1]|uniref:Uncharacterized protein n=1 Tax=Ganoderma sinense ZZ0214-1 TaxID=1077348 RepID=A0A2G8S2X1_9APHY|nr:hypothetical protein GSI_09745 [Ganoderma sinense ZZ0214-1]